MVNIRRIGYCILSFLQGKPKVKSDEHLYFGGGFGNRTKLSMLKCIKAGVIWCEYGPSRHDALLMRMLTHGLKVDRIHRSSEAETYGYPDKPIGSFLNLPMEHKNGHIIKVDGNGGVVKSRSVQPKDYSSREVSGHTCILNRGGKDHNQLWSMITGQYAGVEFPNLKGIVTGMIRDGNEWIACVIDKGIQSSKGWHIPDGCVDIIEYAGMRIGALSDGRVVEFTDKIKDTLFNTRQKPQRFVIHDGLLILFTSRRDEVWAYDGRKGYRLASQEGETPTDWPDDQSLFDASGDSGHGYLWWGRTIHNQGVEVRRLKIKRRF